MPAIGDVIYGAHKATFQARFFDDPPLKDMAWDFKVECRCGHGHHGPCRSERQMRVMAKRLRKDVQRMASDPEFLAELREATEADMAEMKGQERKG